ncbi:hypothetical protein PG987_007674 [Apiospora arundinis]
MVISRRHEQYANKAEGDLARGSDGAGSDSSRDTVALDGDGGQLARRQSGLSAGASDDDVVGGLAGIALDGGDDESRGDGGGGVGGLVTGARLADGVGGHPLAGGAGGAQDCLVDGGEDGLRAGDGGQAAGTGCGARQEGRGGGPVVERHLVGWWVGLLFYCG